MPGRWYRKGEPLGYVIGKAPAHARVVVRQDAIGQLRFATDRVRLRLSEQVHVGPGGQGGARSAGRRRDLAEPRHWPARAAARSQPTRAKQKARRRCSAFSSWMLNWPAPTIASTVLVSESSFASNTERAARFSVVPERQAVVPDELQCLGRRGYQRNSLRRGALCRALRGRGRVARQVGEVSGWAPRSSRCGARLRNPARSLEWIVDETERHEWRMRAATDAELLGLSRDLRVRLRREGFARPLVGAAFALVRETAFRALGQRHYGAQMMGGLALLQGKLVEMATGEGKTVTATLPASVVALAGQPVHIITVNDYLAERDAEEMGADLSVPRFDSRLRLAGHARGRASSGLRAIDYILQQQGTRLRLSQRPRGRGAAKKPIAFLARTAAREPEHATSSLSCAVFTMASSTKRTASLLTMRARR